MTKLSIGTSVHIEVEVLLGYTPRGFAARLSALSQADLQLICRYLQLPLQSEADLVTLITDCLRPNGKPITYDELDQICCIGVLHDERPGQ